VIPKNRVIKISIAVVLLTMTVTVLGLMAFLYFGTPLGKVFGIAMLTKVNFYRPVEDSLLLEGACRGMVDELGDPYSTYMDPNEWQEFLVRTSGEYSGIGVTIDVKEDRLRIALPMKGTPADKAGLKVDDVILRVDGNPVKTTSEAAASIRGPAGTQVVLTIQRDDEVFDIRITRQEISVPAVSYSMMEGNIGYLQLTSFNEHSYSETASALETLKEQGAKAILLDLRYNGGGYLNQCLSISELFVPEGKIVSLRYKSGKLESYSSKSTGFDLPLVVLVNEGTASASEILAGAIQDRGTGVLVGKKTFGKGLVQGSYPLKDGSVVKLTTAEYLTPNGRAINEKGLTPDFLIEGDEAQLQKSIEIARDLIG
jgi:carboxyl-terminal processing protease